VPEPLLVARPDELAPLLRAVEGARRIALDAEGNGLFAYRSRLCTLQLGWEQDGDVHVAIVDTLKVDAAALSDLLGPSGPVKLLHDCTFDVKLLADANVTLSRVRDTSVLARMLGRKATGLASLLASELGIVVEKHLQQHDWSRRPLEPREIAYLADDVRHMMALYDKLAGEAQALCIEEEVETECAFKVQGALAPPRERRPAYLRIRGSEKLDPAGLAVLRRLVEERERIAAEWDQPPFKVASNDWLLSIAHARPASEGDLRRIRGSFSPRLLGAAGRWVAVIRAGLSEGDVPPESADEVRPDRAALAARRAAEKRLTVWRRTEAVSRGVDEQVVLPGHCLQELAALGTSALADIGAVPGLGEKRHQLYGEKLAALLAGVASEPVGAAGGPPGAASEPTPG
jgi:ribonuclease D